MSNCQIKIFQSCISSFMLLQVKDFQFLQFLGVRWVMFQSVLCMEKKTPGLGLYGAFRWKGSYPKFHTMSSVQPVTALMMKCLRFAALYCYDRVYLMQGYPTQVFSFLAFVLFFLWHLADIVCTGCKLFTSWVDKKPGVWGLSCIASAWWHRKHSV